MKEMVLDNLAHTRLQPGSSKLDCTLESHPSERRVTFQSGCIQSQIFMMTEFRVWLYLPGSESVLLIGLSEGPCLERRFAGWLFVKP